MLAAREDLWGVSIPRPVPGTPPCTAHRSGNPPEAKWYEPRVTTRAERACWYRRLPRMRQVSGAIDDDSQTACSRRGVFMEAGHWKAPAALVASGAVGATRPAVELREVSRRYGRGRQAVRALDWISEQFPAGTFTAIMGP